MDAPTNAAETASVTDMGRSWFGVPSVVWAATGLSLVASAGCYLAAGPTLGLFIGGMVIACLLTPALSLIGATLSQRLILAGAVCDGIALVWLIALLTSPISFVDLLRCYMLLIAWCLALVGLAALVAKVVRDPVPASAVIVLLGLLWLTCLIWLPAAVGARIDALLPLHPLMALNGASPSFVLWTHQPLAYRYLFTLGQDVPYTLPTSIWACAGLHLLIGLVALGLSCMRGRR